MTSSLPPLAPPNPLSYGRLHPTTSTDQPDPDPNPNPARPIFRSRRALLLVLSTIFLVAASAILTVAVTKWRRPVNLTGLPVGPTRAITLACGETQYPALCVETLAQFPGAMLAHAQGDLVPISMNVTLGRIGQALMKSAAIGSLEMDTYDRSAYGDCMGMLDDSIDLLNRSIGAVAASATAYGGRRHNKVLKGITADVMTWLSAALTNQDTCEDGLSSASEAIKVQMSPHLQNLSELVSNSLAIYATTYGGDRYNGLLGEPNNNRRLMSSFSEDIVASDDRYPLWMSRGGRALLGWTPVPGIPADVVVAQDGSPGSVRTIAQAIDMAPKLSPRRFVIYIKAGVYREILLIAKKKQNIWLIGDGMGRTVITGSKSVGGNGVTTFDTATLGVSGEGFVARDITFVNDAGPQNHQAVALRLSADRATIFRCEMKGFQDTLYVYYGRHFFRECIISGTVDFIFGNGAVVLQRCTIIARKPMAQQKCTITAQSRKDPREHSGISFHECAIRASAELEPVKGAFPTFLGRPWRVYSRVVYMMSFLGDHIDPKGWLEWAPGLPLDKMYYGEFMNHGPGAGTAGRINWPSVRRHMTRRSADRFTVDQLIAGAPWLTPTGVAFQNGLTS